MKIVIPYKPQPRQIIYHKAKADEILYGGAAGGGKSEATIMDTLKYGMKYEGSRQIIFRRTFPDLQRSIISRSLQVYPKEIAKYNSSKHEWTLINGSIIELAYWDNDSNYMNYQGAEYDVIRWEELTQFEEKWYKYMLSRLRGSKPYPRSVRSTTNPGGVGHSWVKKRFIDVGPPETVHSIPVTDENDNAIMHPLTGEPVINKVMFIPATVHDNQELIKNDPGYLIRLMSLDDKERKQLLEGDWDTFSGQYFSEFTRSIHVVEPFTIPNDWKRFCMLDEGYNDPFVCLWGAIDPDANIYIYREFIKSKLLSSEQATKVKGLSEGERIDYRVADTSFWNKGKASGKSPAEVFAELSVPLIQATKERVNGWKRVREWLHVYDDVDQVSGEKYKNAKLKIFNNCLGLIEALPSMIVDEKNPEDIAAHSLDHAPDALRYGLMSRPHPNIPDNTVPDVRQFDHPSEWEDATGETYYEDDGGYL
ncbi:MAG: phage terminase large subunit [Bacillus sp. (in: firmicutes)]